MAAMARKAASGITASMFCGSRLRGTMMPPTTSSAASAIQMAAKRIWTRGPAPGLDLAPAIGPLSLPGATASSSIMSIAAFIDAITFPARPQAAGATRR